jgi:toxin ParE1/3/4
VRVDWSRRALRDVEDIYEYLADFNPTAAERVVRRLVLQADNLEYFPQRGRPVPGTDLRELVVVYPYIIR